MPIYTVNAVSGQPPKQWEGKFGPMLTYKVRFKEIGQETVEINRKPATKAVSVGEILDGTIEQTEFGKKFKATPKPFGGGSSQPASRPPKDENAIKAMWAIGQAVRMFTNGTDVAVGDIEKNAKDFYTMVDRVKDSVPKGTDNGFDVSVAATPISNQPDFDDFSGSEVVDLDEIPFD